MEEGCVLDHPIIDFNVRISELTHPIINDHQILNFGWLSTQEISQVKQQALRVYDFLSGLFVGVGIRLIECQLEFGKVFNGEKFMVTLADEISNDNCRLCDIHNNEKLGRELMDIDPEKGFKSYQTIAKLLK